MIEQVQGLPCAACTQKEAHRIHGHPSIEYHWIPDKCKKVSELIEIKTDKDRLHELRIARDMVATEARNYGNKSGGFKEENYKAKN